MSAEEIRNGMRLGLIALRDSRLEVATRDAIALLVEATLEVAAQLAELNEKLESAPEETKKLRKVK